MNASQILMLCPPAPGEDNITWTTRSGEPGGLATVTTTRDGIKLPPTEHSEFHTNDTRGATEVLLQVQAGENRLKVRMEALGDEWEVAAVSTTGDLSDAFVTWFSTDPHNPTVPVLYVGIAAGPVTVTIWDRGDES